MFILNWLMGLVTGPIFGQILEGYKAKLAAGTTQEKIAADLAVKELEVQQTQIQANNQLKIAEIGKWYEPEKLFAYTLWIYFTKVYLYDAAFGFGSTDAVHGDVAVWGTWVIGFYFGKRGFENIARILKR